MKQITIVSPNQPEVMSLITELLTENQIDIRHFDSYVAGDDLFIKLLVDDYDRGLSVLTAANYQAIPEETVLVRVEDKPGALAQIARKMTDQRINVRSVTLVHQGQQYWSVAISSDCNDRVREIFKDVLVN